MFKLKAPLIIAGATCLLSMLIGLISGVQFITMLGRGLIAGIGAGGFVFLARVVLERFIPDLFTPTVQADTAPTADTASGTNVNITLDDDNGIPIEGKDASSDSSIAAGSQTGHTEAGSTPDSGNEDSEQTGSAAEAGKIPSSANVETAPASADTSPADNDTQNAAGLSDLPDMGAFMDSSDDIEQSSAGGAIGTPTGFSVEGIQTGGGDSKLMAHAIRTILATED